MEEITKIELPAAAPMPKALPAPMAAMGLMSPRDMAHSVAIEAQGRAVELVMAKMAAMATPRDRQYILDQLEEACSDPEFAEQAMYAKPAGNKKIGNAWKPAFITGPSVRLLERIANVYGNFKVLVNVMPPHNDCTEILVRTMDLQETVEWEARYAVPHQRWQAEKTEYINGAKKVIEPGKVIDVREPDKIRLLVLSETSKQIRNTIKRAVDSFIVRKCEEWCKNTNKITELEMMKNLPSCFENYSKKFNVSQAQLLGFLELEKMADVEPGHIRRLRELWVGIQEGDVDPSELFEGAAKVQKKPAAKPEGEAKSAAKVVKQEAEKKAAEPAPPKEAPPPPPKQEPLPAPPEPAATSAAPPTETTQTTAATPSGAPTAQPDSATTSPGSPPPDDEEDDEPEDEDEDPEDEEDDEPPPPVKQKDKPKGRF